MIDRTIVAPGVAVGIAGDVASSAPAVIVVHEWWGVNEHVRDVGAQLAAAGFVAAVPDLYHGESTVDAARARALAEALDTADAMRDLQAVTSYLADGGRAVAIVGFSLGGAMALAAAGHVTGLAAAVPFYGLPLARWLDPSRIAVPVQGHFAARDAMFPPAKVRVAFQALVAGGVDVELCEYDAGHGFMSRGATTHDEVAAATAWSRMVAFLRRSIG